MEKIPPAPRLPKNELLNIEKLNIIQNYPHLLTPIQVNHFCKLLESHPNRPLVNSICEGLKSGFWPWAVTFNSDAPLIVDNSCLQKVKDPRHLQFIKEQRDKKSN